MSSSSDSRQVIPTYDMRRKQAIPIDMGSRWECAQPDILENNMTLTHFPGRGFQRAGNLVDWQSPVSDLLDRHNSGGSTQNFFAA